jgi:hypothetical protein
VYKGGYFWLFDAENSIFGHFFDISSKTFISSGKPSYEIFNINTVAIFARGLYLP